MITTLSETEQRYIAAVYKWYRGMAYSLCIVIVTDFSRYFSNLQVHSLSMASSQSLTISIPPCQIEALDDFIHGL